MNEYLEKITDLIVAYTPKVVGALITLIVGFWLVGRFTRMLRRSLTKQHRLDDTIKPFLVSAFNIGFKVLLLFSIAGMFGVETTSFIAIFSALAFAIGIALQGNLANFASGILILLLKPFKVGEVIVTQGYTGKVKEIQLFHTFLTTLDNRNVIIPNSVITGNPIENLTSLGERQLDLTFGVDYACDIDKVREVLEGEVKNCPYYIAEKDHLVAVKGLADSSVNFAVRLWVTPENYWNAFFYMHEHVKKALDRAGLGIPFPQLDIRIKQN